MAGFHSFLVWVGDNVRADWKVPKFPWPEPDEHVPTIISQELQFKIILTIPEEKRGIFYCLAECLVRPSEARVLRVRDFRNDEIHVSRAAKDKKLNGLVRGLKARNAKTVPVPDMMLGLWLHQYVSDERRLADPDGPLFVNPEGADRWFAESTLRRIWRKACAKVGVQVSLYEGTKHSSASHLKALGADDRLLAKLMGHRDPRSVEKYAKLDSTAIRDGLLRLQRKAGGD